MNIPASLERLVAELARLPGVGQKTAQRLAFSILRNDAARAHALASAIEEVKARIRFCEQCCGYAEDALCSVCADPRRDAAVLCVVEQPGDIYVIERSGVFRGRYHVLHGVISPLDGIGPDQLKIRELLARETNLPRWRELQWAFRRMEDRGQVRGGRFVGGFVGEQFALPGASTASVVPGEV